MDQPLRNGVYYDYIPFDEPDEENEPLPELSFTAPSRCDRCYNSHEITYFMDDDDNCEFPPFSRSRQFQVSSLLSAYRHYVASPVFGQTPNSDKFANDDRDDEEEPGPNGFSTPQLERNRSPQGTSSSETQRPNSYVSSHSPHTSSNHSAKFKSRYRLHRENTKEMKRALRSGMDKYISNPMDWSDYLNVNEYLKNNR